LKQDWEALIRNFMKEFYSPTKTSSLRNKIDTFAQFPIETTLEASERFNEYLQAKFLEWHINLLMRRMQKMGMERDARPKGCRGKIHMREV
jgi:DNA-binding NtrC family response regulator